ncbi:hypothetical protein L9F63_009492, partial [Diploptera punctata]
PSSILLYPSPTPSSYLFQMRSRLFHPSAFHTKRHQGYFTEYCKTYIQVGGCQFKQFLNSHY